MLTRELLIRIAGPSLLVSLLCLLSCTAGAIYLSQRQSATVQALDEILRSRDIVDDLLQDLDDVVVKSLDGDSPKEFDELHEHVGMLLREAESASNRPGETEIIEKLKDKYDRYLKAVQTHTEPTETIHGAPDRSALFILERDVRSAARDLDAYITRVTKQSQVDIRRVASWMAWGLMGIGILGLAGGIAFGYSAAKGLERAVMRAKALAAVGQIAAGMAHELRNPLTAISMLVQIQCEKAEQNGLPAEDLQMIEQEVGRMERRLNAFIDFARPPRPHRRRTDMVPLVAQTLALVAGRATKQNVNVEFDHPPTPIFIEADGEQIRQLLLNLFMNALDVMPRGGTLTLKLEQPSESRAELFVSDNGPGLDPKQLPRVFEPYFTSKEMGLGLGLPISQRIAQDHGGNLVATNRTNGGACFILKLPTIAESIETNQGTGHAESARDR